MESCDHDFLTRREGQRPATSEQVSLSLLIKSFDAENLMKEKKAI